MRVEVVCWDTCPECGGTMRVTLPELTLGSGLVVPEDEGDCDRCEDGTVSRVLATLPERAELRERIVEAIDDAAIHRKYERGVRGAADAILAIFGLGEEPA